MSAFFLKKIRLVVWIVVVGGVTKRGKWELGDGQWVDSDNTRWAGKEVGEMVMKERMLAQAPPFPSCPKKQNSRSSLTFTRLHDERHTLPTRVVDPQNHRSKRRTSRALGDSFVVEVTWLFLAVAVFAADVLTEENVVAVDRGDASEDLDLGECISSAQLGSQDYRAHCSRVPDAHLPIFPLS